MTRSSPRPLPEPSTFIIVASDAALTMSPLKRCHAQAASEMVSIDTLKAAFADVYAAMDAVDTYKAAALDSMAQTVSSLEAEVAAARQYLDRSGQPDQ